MKKRYIGFAGLGLVLILGTQQVQAQQGFGTKDPHKTAAVDIQSSKRGLLIPRVELVQTTNGTTPVQAPAQSLMVYNEKTQNDVTPGYYYWDTNRWVRFAQQGDITSIALTGDVTGPTNATVVGAIQGVDVSETNPTANQVLTYIPGVGGKEGQWTPVSLDETLLTSSKGITATGITVGGETNGANSTLKNVTLAITPGGANQVMVTAADGLSTTWIDQSTIAPATTHTLVKKENTNGNTLVSTVNGVSSETNLIATVANTLTDATLTTTVNGVAAPGLDLTPAIQAAQKITTVADGVNTTVSSSVNPAGGNTTEYKVNVSNEAIQTAQKTTVVAAGTGVTVTPATVANVTTYTVAADASTITLAGDVTGNAGANTISNLQGTEVAAAGTKTEGQALVFQGGKWIPGTPKIDATDIKEAKNLLAADGATATIEVVSGGTNAVLVETSLRVKAESITSSEIKNGSILPVDIAKDKADQVLITDVDGNPIWKNQADLHKNIYTHDGTLTANRTVDFGTNTHLTFKRGNQEHDFTYDDVHTGLNMYGTNASSLGLISSTNANGSQSQLNIVHRTSGSEINSNSTGGLKIVAENRKDITFSTSEANEGKDNVVFQGNGGVKVININTDAFKGAATDKIVVADATGVLKTLKAAMPKFFYMPSVLVPTAENQTTQAGVTFDNGTRKGTINLYAIYQQQFGSPVMSSVPGATLPVLPASELIFHVTYATSNVFTINSISATGLMTYTVSATANVNMGSFINVVFSVKE